MVGIALGLLRQLTRVLGADFRAHDPAAEAAARLGYVPSRRRLLAVISRPVPTMPNVPSAHHAHQIPPMSMSQGLINMVRPSDPGASHNAYRDCTKALISPAADLHHLSTGDRKRMLGLERPKQEGACNGRRSPAVAC